MGVKVAFQSAPEPGLVKAGFVIPKEALRQQDGREIVLLLQDGKVERRAVKTAVTQGDEIMVSTGLAAGDKVIVKGPEHLKEGDRVQEMPR
jgi:membrane fusion protein (multidrug efflux system)